MNSEHGRQHFDTLYRQKFTSVSITRFWCGLAELHWRHWNHLCQSRIFSVRLVYCTYRQKYFLEIRLPNMGPTLHLWKEYIYIPALCSEISLSYKQFLYNYAKRCFPPKQLMMIVLAKENQLWLPNHNYDHTNNGWFLLL